MDSFLNMVVFDVWNGPDIARVLSQRVARILTLFFALEVFFSGVLLGDHDWGETSTHVFATANDIEPTGLITLRFGASPRKAAHRPQPDYSLCEGAACTSPHPGVG